jgi:glutamyl-tRNA synthetase
VVEFVDALHGPTQGRVDDFVLRRNDGVPAYNLAVVVDDAAQGIDQVVRGDDLLSSTPRQIHLARLLGLTVPTYAHVPLVLAPDGSRLAKRHGAVTLADLAGRGVDAAEVRSRLATTLGLATEGESVGMPELVDRFDPGQLPRAPWTYQEDQWLSTPP